VGLDFRALCCSITDTLSILTAAGQRITSVFGPADDKRQHKKDRPSPSSAMEYPELRHWVLGYIEHNDEEYFDELKHKIDEWEGKAAEENDEEENDSNKDEDEDDDGDLHNDDDDLHDYYDYDDDVKQEDADANGQHNDIIMISSDSSGTSSAPGTSWAPFQRCSGSSTSSGSISPFGNLAPSQSSFRENKESNNSPLSTQSTEVQSEQRNPIHAIGGGEQFFSFSSLSILK